MEGPSRKRLRRSTRTCYQCENNGSYIYSQLTHIPGRKRKVKCQLTDKDVDTCAECIKSGTQCTIQAPFTEENLESSPSNAHKKEYDLRLERIESLLRKLVDASEQSGSSAQLPTAPSSLWNDLVSSVRLIQSQNKLAENVLAA
jgi:hypothetical protein